LTNNSNLRHLWLTGLILDEDSARNLAEGFRQSRLEYLEVFPDVLKQQSAWQIVAYGIQSSSTIHTLAFFNLGEMPLGFVGNLLTELRTLQSLSFHNFEGDELCEILGDNLGKSSSLTKLALDNGRLSVISIKRLGQGLLQNTSLKILDFESCQLNHAHIAVLMEQWHPDLQIEALCLQGNNICDRGLQMLLSAITTGRMPIRKLDLSFNHSIGYKGLQLIGEALPSLKSLTDVNTTMCCDYTYVYNKRVTKYAQDKASRAILNGMKHALHLKRFYTWHNQLREDMENEFSFYDFLIRNGRYLLSSDQRLASTVWCHVLDWCQSRKRSFFASSKKRHIASAIYYFLCEQPSLVQSGRR
jgi:hypothetical protein